MPSIVANVVFFNFVDIWKLYTETRNRGTCLKSLPKLVSSITHDQEHVWP